jgi:hypothetical protein
MNSNLQTNLFAGVFGKQRAVAAQSIAGQMQWFFIDENSAVMLNGK